MPTLSKIRIKSDYLSAPDNGACLGWRDGEGPYQWLHYNESLLRARNFAAGLISTGEGSGGALICSREGARALRPLELKRAIPKQKKTF